MRKYSHYIEDTALSQVIAMFDIETLMVGAADNHLTPETRQRLVIERSTEDARRVDLALDVIIVIGSRKAVLGGMSHAPDTRAIHVSSKYCARRRGMAVRWSARPWLARRARAAPCNASPGVA